MLVASKRKGELLRALKWALTGTELFLVSIDGRNGNLTRIMETFNPIFVTKETMEAGYFTAKIFKDVEVLIDEEPFLQVEQENTLSSNLANLVFRMKEDITSCSPTGEEELENEQISRESEEKEEEPTSALEKESENSSTMLADGNIEEGSVDVMECKEESLDNVDEC